jgi:UPF0271 protein
VAADEGVAVAEEGFADRAYAADGTLLPRDAPRAVLHDPAAVAARVGEFLRTGCITAADGTALPLRLDSLCVHGDTAGAVAIARAVRAAVLAAGWRVAPFAR